MTDAEDQERQPARNPLVERSPIILGAVGAVVAVVCLFGLSWQLLVVGQSALAWIQLGIAGMALAAVGRGAPNVRAIIVAVVAVGGFAFWIIAPEQIGALPVWAYLVTAAADLALGLAAPRVDPSRSRSVLIAAAGVVVFTAVSSASRFGA